MSPKEWNPIYKLFITFFSIVVSADAFCQASPTAGIEPYYDLNFTAAERDSLLTGLQDYQKSIAAIHQASLENNVPMSLVFNPLPPGYKIEAAQKTIDWGLPKKVDLPADAADLAMLPVNKLAVLLKNKRITSEAL